MLAPELLRGMRSGLGCSLPTIVSGVPLRELPELALHRA